MCDFKMLPSQKQNMKVKGVWERTGSGEVDQGYKLQAA